jgi:Phage integrase family
LEPYRLPPIRLHDLRHGTATVALAAGADIKIVQEMLGHSSRAITSDTYTSVLPDVARAAVEAAAAMIPLGTIGANEQPPSNHRPRRAASESRNMGKTPDQDGCAARDLNPEPAD